MSNPPDVKIKLESSPDKQEFMLELRLALKSKVLSDQLSNNLDNEEILKETFTLEVRAPILSKIVEFLVWEDKHPHTEIEKPLKSSDIKDFMDPWCVKFLDIPNTELFELILRANYMGIPPLLDIACGKVAAMTRNKPVETIRKEFNIVNDFTPEEEAPIIEEQKWLDEA